LGLKRLGNPAVCPGGGRLGFVEGLEGAGQQQDRHALKRGIFLDRPAQFVAVFAGHEDVCQNQVRTAVTRCGQGGIAVVDDDQIVVLIGKGDGNHLLNGDAVVGQQQFFAHPNLLAPLNFVRDRSPAPQKAPKQNL
jgi:hypothetical protein